MAATSERMIAAAQAAPRRRFRPKADSTRARPRMLDRKWLISMSQIGDQLISQPNRRGSDGVAPDTSSITPAASVSRAPTFGAACRIAGLRPFS